MLHLGLYFATAVLHFSTRGDMGIGIMLFVSVFLGHIIDHNLKHYISGTNNKDILGKKRVLVPTKS